MTKPSPNRKTPENKLSRHVTIAFKQEEYMKLYAEYQTTTKRSFSEFLRCALLGKKIARYTRSRSLDELVQELIELRKEFSLLSQGFKEQASGLGQVSDPAYRSQWSLQLEWRYKLLLAKTEEVKQKINQIAEKWWHE